MIIPDICRKQLLRVSKKYNLYKKYIQECKSCGNVVVGKEKRGFIRDALHGGPGTAVEFIPVGGKLIWKAT